MSATTRCSDRWRILWATCTHPGNIKAKTEKVCKMRDLAGPGQGLEGLGLALFDLIDNI